MCSGTWPNFNAWLATAWGAGGEFWAGGLGSLFQAASNLVLGQNPAYYLDDFLLVYPKFFGAPTLVSNAGITNGSNVISLPSVTGLLPGMLLQHPAFPKGTVITGLNANSITVNNSASSSSSGQTLIVYASTPIPTTVIQLYLNLAYASLVQARWQENWYVGMALFIAHYCTLYARSELSDVVGALQTIIHGEQPQPLAVLPTTLFSVSAAPPGGVLTLTSGGELLRPNGVDYSLSGSDITLTNALSSNNLWATWLVQQQSLVPQPMTGAQIAAQGLAGGIQTSKSVGDVSVGYQALESLKDWGAWQLTSYGQLLATMANVIGMGPMVIW